MNFETFGNQIFVNSACDVKAKGMTRNVVATIIGTYEINRILLSCYDDKILIQNNGYHGLALG